MRVPILLAALFGCLSASLPAQLSGNYTVGTGGAYPSFTAASAALSAGVSGPVQFMVLPGTYTESFSLGPVTGASATNTITFQPLAPGTVNLVGTAAGATSATCMFTGGTSAAPVDWYILDGLEFTSGAAPAIYSATFVRNIEIRNCTFLAGHTTYILNLRGGNISGWKVHHNKFTFIPNQRGFYLSQIADCLFYANEFDLNGCDYGWYMINTNNSRNRAFNNLFYGAIRDTANSYGLYIAASQYDWDVSLNTFVVDTGTVGNMIRPGGCCTTRMTNMYGNVFVNLGNGPTYFVAGTGTVPAYTYYRGDGNVFYSPANPTNPDVAVVITAAGNVSYDLAGWRTLTNQDAASIVANPMLTSITLPNPDLRPLPGSPVKDSAVPFPGYATFAAFPIEDDYEGTIRGATADAGAYELRPVFGRFQEGCAGSGAQVPDIGATGTLAIPSPTFAITLDNALGGSIGLLTLGTSATSFGAIELPHPIGGGCSIQNNLIVVLPVAVGGSGPGNGTATMPLPIPNDPALSGGTIYAQWLVVDSGSGSPFGIATTRSGAIQL